MRKENHMTRMSNNVPIQHSQKEVKPTRNCLKYIPLCFYAGTQLTPKQLARKMFQLGELEG